MRMNNERTYLEDNVIKFRKTKEKYGGLSNMAGGYPVKVNDITIRSVEALYQCIRFTENSNIQKQIIDQKSPMTAKMISKKFNNSTRNDWYEIRLKAMRWCLRVKLIQNWDSFGGLLLETENKEIVEESRKDRFWGALPLENGDLKGTNALGRLLMELREEIPTIKNSNELLVPRIPSFKLFGDEIESINFNYDSTPKRLSKNNPFNSEYLSFFE